MRGLSFVLTVASFASDIANAATPVNIGIILYPGYQVIDAFGPLDLLNVLSWRTFLNLTIIGATLDPISSKANISPMASAGSDVEERVIPRHSFADAPPLDVLFIPGGLGNRLPSIDTTVDFVRERYPSLQYLITVCTGAGIAAKAGILDGKNATTNKWAFKTITPFGPKTWWHSQARWIVDGNVWTSSGVSAGIDATLAWIAHVWDEKTANELAIGMEYDWHRDPSWDPFGVYHNVSDVSMGVTLAPSTSPGPTLTSSTTSSPTTPVVTTQSTTTTKITTKKSTTSTTTRTTKTTAPTKTHY